MPHPGGPRLEANDISLNNVFLSPRETPPPPLDPDDLGPPRIDFDTDSSGVPVEAVVNPEPTPLIPRLSTLKTALVSAVSRHTALVTFRGPGGQEYQREVKSQDVIMAASEKYGDMKMQESKNKREGNKFKLGLERFWKGTFMKDRHKVKEKNLGRKIMAEAGVETGISVEFDTAIEQRARERIESQMNQQPWWQKGWNKLRYFGSEAVGRETDLHREKLKITRELRADYLRDPGNPDNPLVALMNRDVAARQALADNVMDSDVDFLHAGDKKTESIKVERGTDFDNFLKKDILLKIKDDIVSQSEQGRYTGKINPKLRAELDQMIQDYTFSDGFEAFKATLTDDQRKQFENSFTYASNILSQAEESFVPTIHENFDHFRSVSDLDMDIEITLGTAKFGPEGEIRPPKWYEKNGERVSLNQEVYDKVREKVKANRKNILFTDADVNAGLKREQMLAFTNMIVGSEFFAATFTMFTTRAAMTALHSSLSVFPVIGSALAAGAFGTAKEYNNLGEIRQQFGYQEAEGLSHPVGDALLRAEQMRQFEYKTVDLGHRNQQIEAMVDKLVSGDTSEATILQTMAYLADSRARIALSDVRGINLFRASKDTPEGRGIYQVQETTHNKSRALAMARLTGMLDGDTNTDLRNRIATSMGLDPATHADARSLIINLADAQYKNLESGTVDNGMRIAFATDSENLIIKTDESVTARDEAFRKWRIRESLVKGATIGVVAGAFAGLVSAGSEHFSELHSQVIETGVERGPITILSQNTPTHISALPNGAGIISHPQTGEILDQITSAIPNGTRWVEDVAHPGQFDLVLEGESPRVLLNNATFTDEGLIQLTPSIKEDIVHNHLNIDYIPHSTEIEYPVVGTETVSTNTVDLNTWELEGYQEGGFWNWYRNTLTENGVDPTDQRVNAILKTARGVNTFHNGSDNVTFATAADYPDHPALAYNQILHSRQYSNELEEVFHGKVDLMAAPQGSKAIFEDVPATWGTPAGHVKIANLFDAAKADVEAGVAFGDDLEGQVKAIIYEAGTSGEHGIPNDQEVDILLEYFGESSTTTETFVLNDNRITLTDDLITMGEVPYERVVEQTVTNPAFLFVPAGGYIRPLEQAEGVVRRITPIPLPPPEEGERPPIDMGYGYGYGYGFPSIQVTDQSLPPYGMESDDTSNATENRTIENYYRSRMMPQLATNKDFAPSFKESTDWYLAKQSPQYLEALKRLNAQVKPMGENVKEVVCIPVAAGQEGNNIYKTLQKYSVQVNRRGEKINSEVEVILFLNRPENVNEDHTAREIERFMSENPDTNIVPVYGVFEPGKVKYGAFIKYPYDLALMRARARRINGDKDIIIASGDADLEDMSPTYVSDTIDYFDTNPKKEAGLAKQDMDPKILAEFPTFYATVRFQQFVEALARGSKYTENRRHIQTQGRTTLMRGSTLAALGGVNSYTGAGADTELGKMLLLARTDKIESASGPETPFEYLNVAEIRTNPRRELINILMGGTYTETWNQFNANMENDNVRKMSMDKLIAEYGTDKLDVKEFERQINSFRHWNVSMDGKHVERALGFLGLRKGIDYNVNGNGKDATISLISDCSAVQKIFDQFKSEVKS